MLSESAGGALTTARNTETHFAARLYNIFNIVLLLHKLPGPLLTTAVNRHISSRLLGSPLLRHTAASPASPATSCPEGWTHCFFCLSTLSCVYTDRQRHFSRGTVPSHSPRMFFFILICILSGFIFMMSAVRPWSFILPFSRYQPPLLLLMFGGLNFLWTPARFLLPCTTTGKSSLDSKWRIKKAKPNKKTLLNESLIKEYDFLSAWVCHWVKEGRTVSEKQIHGMHVWMCLHVTDMRAHTHLYWHLHFSRKTIKALICRQGYLEMFRHPSSYVALNNKNKQKLNSIVYSVVYPLKNWLLSMKGFLWKPITAEAGCYDITPIKRVKSKQL